MKSRDVVFVEPFMAGSHAAFAEGWIAHSRHRWRVLALPGTRWKWRLRTAGLVLGPRLAALRPVPEVVVSTSLLDLAHLRQQAGPALSRTRFLLYVHENELTYPRAVGQPLDRGFAALHVASLLAADGIAFNSRSHRDALREALAAFRAEWPRPHPPRLAGVLRGAAVLPPGVDLDGFPEPAQRAPGDPPAIVWNHRWEEDKRPAAFARTVLDLVERGRDLRLILLGTTEQVHPRPLELLRERVPDRLLRDRPARTRAEYVRWLGRADIAVSTSIQENFGYAAVEAMAAGAVPLLPDRLSYPELMPAGLRRELLYRSDRDLLARLSSWLIDPGRFTPLRARVMRAARAHAWPSRAAALDDWIDG